MNNDPLEFYASKMREVKASERLLDSVRHEADAARSAVQQAKESQTTCDASQQASDPRPARNTTAKIPHASRRTRIVHPRKTKQPARFKFAMAACLAALALVVGISLTLPGMGSSANLENLAFSVKAYGSFDETVIPDKASNMIVFDFEAETQRMVSPAGMDQYSNIGFYTGCVFHVEGENITRVQANISRGELYRVTSKEYSFESDPDFAREANAWKYTKIGEGELLGKYDYVTGSLFYEGIDADGKNVGKLRGDPSILLKQFMYQRLGATVDVPVSNETGSQLSDYAFGLWTNEPFEETPHDGENFDYDTYDPDANTNAALDTLDGTQLTVTVTFADGTCSTQVIDLKAADFKANVVTVAVNGMNTMLELVPQIIDVSGKTVKEKREDYDRGIASIHTLYGIISKTNDEAFPCGEASYPNLTEPLTEPVVFGPPPTPVPDDYDPHLGPDIDKAKVENSVGTPLDDSQHSASAGDGTYVDLQVTRTIDRIERADRLPDGVTIANLTKYFTMGGYHDPNQTDIVDDFWGYTIHPDGTLSSGFSYALVTKTITNRSVVAGEIYLDPGYFLTLEDNPDDESTYRTRMQSTDPLWRSNHDGPDWDPHLWFQMVGPGESMEITLLYIVPNEALDNPNLAYTYSHDYQGKVARVGAVS